MAKPTDDVILAVPPTGGFTLLPWATAPASSIVSGQNVWVRDDALEPRFRLSSASFASQTVVDASNITEVGVRGQSSNSNYSVILGAFLYDMGANPATAASPDLIGSVFPIVGTCNNFFRGMGTSNGAVSRLSFIRLGQTSSAGTTIPPVLGNIENWFGTNILSASRGSYLGVWTGAVGPWHGGPGGVGARPTAVTYCHMFPDTTFSHLTGAPGAKDAITLANRVVLWNCNQNYSVASTEATMYVSIFNAPYLSTESSSANSGLLMIYSLQSSTVSFWQENPTASAATFWGLFRSRMTTPSVFSSGYASWVTDASVATFQSNYSGVVTQWSSTSAAGAKLESWVDATGSRITALSTSLGVVAYWTDTVGVNSTWTDAYPTSGFTSLSQYTYEGTPTTYYYDNTVVPNRAQWCVAGEPEDWVGTGSGFEDLADMIGTGTRAFVQDDTAYFATEREIWRGRYVGMPYVFQFAPLARNIGIPYPRAALATPHGFVWLGAGFEVWMLAGDAITEIGKGFQEVLRQTLATPRTAFFTFNVDLDQLRLFYSADRSTPVRHQQRFPTHSITLDMNSGVWSHDVYAHWFQRGLSDPTKLVDLYADYGTATNKIEVPEILFTSAATASQFIESATSDLGTIPTEEALFGCGFPEPFVVKTLVDTRFDFRANSSSNVTVAWVDDLGGLNSNASTTLTVSATSHTSQYAAPVIVSARYPQLRLTSQDGGTWKLARYSVRAKLNTEQ